MLLSRVWLFVTPWTAAHQAPLSIGFPRQEHWNGLPFPSPWDLPNPGIKPTSPALADRFFTTEPPGKPSTGSGTKQNLNSSLSSSIQLGCKEELEAGQLSVCLHMVCLCDWLGLSSSMTITGGQTQVEATSPFMKQPQNLHRHQVCKLKEASLKTSPDSRGRNCRRAWKLRCEVDWGPSLEPT